MNQDKNTDNINVKDLDNNENKYLIEGLKRTYKERFLFLTNLIKIQNTLKKAKITHKK
ncbi:MAG: hypothetical protein K1X55_03500 [Chitinophagales bacterium]|nr:hypothetical protein [Chitinophagales bacterium]